MSTDSAFYEDWRQEDLTTSLGQVQCQSGGIHAAWGSIGAACPFCKAER